MDVLYYPCRPYFMRLKSFFAKNVCEDGASIPRGVPLLGGVLTGVRIFFSSTANLLHRNPLPLPVAGHIVLNITVGKC